MTQQHCCETCLWSKAHSLFVPLCSGTVLNHKGRKLCSHRPMRQRRCGMSPQGTLRNSWRPTRAGIGQKYMQHRRCFQQRAGAPSCGTYPLHMQCTECCHWSFEMFLCHRGCIPLPHWTTLERHCGTYPHRRPCTTSAPLSAGSYQHYKHRKPHLQRSRRPHRCVTCPQGTQCNLSCQMLAGNDQTRM